MPADACVDRCADDVRAAITLAMGALRAGSHIDVYRDGCFWEAVIVGVCGMEFRFRFLHTGRRREYGRVLRRDFLRSWRFPIRDGGDVWKAAAIAGCASDED